MEHTCIKEGVIDSLQKENEKYYKVLYGNGQKGLIEVIPTLNANIQVLHSNIAILNETIPEMKNNLKEVLDFMIGEKALKVKTVKRWNWGLATLSVIVAIVSIWLNNTKTSVPEVKEQIQEQRTIYNNKVKSDAKTAHIHEEMKSQLSNDTIR